MEIILVSSITRIDVIFVGDRYSSMTTSLIKVVIIFYHQQCYDNGAVVIFDCINDNSLFLKQNRNVTPLPIKIEALLMPFDFFSCRRFASLLYSRDRLDAISSCV